RRGRPAPRARRSARASARTRSRSRAACEGRGTPARRAVRKSCRCSSCPLVPCGPYRAMSETRHLLDDLQASPPDVRIGLSRAGVQGVAKAIRLRWGGAEKLISAEIDCTVDL